ncbi:uncharacterized protein LOC141610884 [Silene latifolia]|uniref:uncharacterized protein LOC141610884 n=1 Tax=Silene latifolia TaxID=37657 RepID=UPI003D76D31A
MRIKVVQKTAPSPSKKFTRIKNYHHSDSNSHPQYLHATTVYLLRPPSLSSDRPWIILPTTNSDSTVVFRHPLTSKPQLFNLPRNFDFSKLHPSAIAVSYQIPVSDKLVVIPTPLFYSRDSVDARQSTLLALYAGGELRGCAAAASSSWVNLSHFEKLDDIAVYGDKVYTASRKGRLKLINNYSNIFNLSRTLIFQPLIPGPGRFGWRKRLVVDDNDLLLVVRMEEKVFRVFTLKSGVKGYYWDEVCGFKGNKVLFMARDYYFFRRASRKFPGREYKNCIVFSEAAFPQYGNDCWDFSKYDDEIAVFWLDDKCFGREGENSGFPKINWSPPAWIFRDSSVQVPADEFQSRSESVSSSQLERETGEDEGLDSGCRDENDGEVKSDLKDPNRRDEEEQEEMESDFSSQDQDPEVVEIIESDSGSLGQDQEVVEIVDSDSDIQDLEDGKMECNSNSDEKEDKEVHSEANIKGNASLREDILMQDIVMPSVSAIEEEITKTSGNDVVETEISGKNTTHLIPKACTTSTTENHKSESATAKFEGLDIRSDLVPALQKIWRKHGNVTTDSIVRSSDIIARALESLAIMVHILEDNLAESLSDSQAEYLSSTLSDLKCLRFKVYWLVSFVEKALKVHKGKDLVESLNNLSQLSSQVKERKSVILDELAKLNDEENRLKEERAKVSKMIPLYGQVKFDEPIGVGLT